MSEFGKLLAKADSGWKESKAAAKAMSGEAVPADTYIAKLRDAKGQVSKNGKPQIRVNYVILEGKLKGVTLTDFQNAANAQNLAFVRLFIEAVGYEAPATADELEDVLDEMSKDNPQVKLKVTTREWDGRTYNNIRLLEVLDGEETPADTEGTQEPGTTEDQSGEWDEGSRVYVDEFGPESEGIVESVDEDKETAEIKFDDDDEGVFKWDEIHPVDDEESEKPEKATEDPEPKPSENYTNLVTFAKSQKLEVSDDDDEEAVLEIIKEFDYEINNLKPDQIKLLKDNDLHDHIAPEKEAPKKKKKKKAVKKVVKKKKKKR